MIAWIRQIAAKLLGARSVPRLSAEEIDQGLADLEAVGPEEIEAARCRARDAISAGGVPTDVESRNR